MPFPMAPLPVFFAFYFTEDNIDIYSFCSLVCITFLCSTGFPKAKDDSTSITRTLAIKLILASWLDYVAPSNLRSTGTTVCLGGFAKQFRTFINQTIFIKVLSGGNSSIS